ncbi:unnamed protein product [Closterium sp. NIES-65]|nr:unnamed protein product [Closterium sp. NIES-65]
MAITIYFIATSLPDCLASVRDALLLKHPSELTVDVLESALKDVESNLRSVAAASGAVPPPLFHGCTVPQLPTFTASLATAATDATAAAVTTSTTLTPLPAPVSVALADPTLGPVTARHTTTLPCLVAPSGSLTGFHVPSFSRNLVVTSPQVVVSSPVAASCSCQSLAHPTVLWHHRMGHPSLPRLRAMSSQRLVLGLPRVLLSLPPSLAPPCGPCVEGRLRATPHSSSLRPATEPFETLHLDVWGPASRLGPERERFFLVVVDDYSRYTTVFPLAKKSEVTSTLIRWLLTTADTRGLRVSCLHSDRVESPQQNGVAGRRIGLVMEIARTSLTHARAPHFLWPYVVRYAAHQLNLWPRVSWPEASPTSLWTGSPGVASRFRVWGCLALVRDTSADKLSPRAVPCVFLGFPEDSSDFTFYHPPSHRFFDSRDVRFEESTPYYVRCLPGYPSSFGSPSGTASLPTVLLAACRRC